MLLTLTTERAPATDLGWLLHKHPAKVQRFELSFGEAVVFYPEAADERCTVALLLDVDPVALVRRRRGPAGDGFSLQQYVNDRPYVASSFMSVAIGQVLGSALGGRCKGRPGLAEAALPLEARIAVLPCRGGEDFLRRLFEPLGYDVSAERHVLDAKFLEWGASNYYTVTLRATKRLQDVLTHLYVLIPVLDNDKHYWVGDDELEKLLRRGAGWLGSHPERELIARRYLKHQYRLARAALARLAEEDHPDPDAEEAAHGREEALLEATVRGGASPGAGANGGAQPRNSSENSEAEATAGSLGGVSELSAGATDVTHGEKDSDPARASAVAAGAERGLSLHEQRLATVLAALRGCGAKSVVDVGCGEGRLLRLLLDDRQFARIAGMDISLRSLKAAAARLRLERLPEAKRRRVGLFHGSLTYRDARLRLDAATPFDAAACVEVIEHLDRPRLGAFERVVFEFARPGTVIITTPNREYNVMWESLPAGKLRHRDHRFEWTRPEFEGWARGVAGRFGYRVRFLPIGPEAAGLGAPTQMGLFSSAG